MAESRPAHEADDGQIDLEFTEDAQEIISVSYTHLTLPTIYSV